MRLERQQVWPAANQIITSFRLRWWSYVFRMDSNSM